MKKSVLGALKGMKRREWKEKDRAESERVGGRTPELGEKTGVLDRRGGATMIGQGNGGAVSLPETQPGRDRKMGG